MLSLDEISKLKEDAGLLVTPVEDFVISDICRTLAEAGKITSTAKYLAYRAQKLGIGFEELKKEIAKRLGVSVVSLQKMFDETANKHYTSDINKLDSSYTPYHENAEMLRLTRAAKALAEADFTNITQTIGMVNTKGENLPLKKAYRNHMDAVFSSVSTGVMDYNTAIRLASVALASKGLTVVEYESGVTTSLEAAVRRNVMGGLGLMVEQITKETHKQLGATGWEISAHINSAEDHEDIQGLQFSNEEFEKLNGELKRRIGTLNCGHFALPIILGVNKPQYTKEKLQQLKNSNAKGVTVNGKHYTGYEAKKRQRTLERRIRYWKRRNLAAESTNNPKEIKNTRSRLNLARRAYTMFSKEAGLRVKNDRTFVSGFGAKEASRARRSAQPTPQKPSKHYGHEITKEHINNVPLVKSSLLNNEQNIKLQQAHKDLLKSAQALPRGTETVANYSMDMSKLSAQHGTTGHVAFADFKVPFVSMHNHPSGETFSPADINQFVMSANFKIMSAVGNNGKVYLIEKLEDFDASKFIGFHEEISIKHLSKTKDLTHYYDFFNELMNGAKKHGLHYIG